MLGFHTREMPLPGCHATPFQGHLLTTARRETSFAPSYHFVTDLGTDEAWTNLPGGPSESRFSPFYKNDVIRWQTGTYKRLGGRPSGRAASVCLLPLPRREKAGVRAMALRRGPHPLAPFKKPPPAASGRSSISFIISMPRARQ